ncbi:MAG: hypothetical protein JO307_11980 [Bryobacterales bacterium]|nr:hypothetical protein [Bryobacterales bacterium]
MLVLIGLPLVIPLLLADDRPELPACCRRNGKYHCATSVMNAAPFPAAQTFGAFQLKCPFFPKPGGLPTYSKAAMFVLGWQVVPVSPLRVQLEYPNYPFQKRRLAMPSKKRGPPPVFS